MLHGINPNVTHDLLSVLARMGHGDEIVIADTNFPAASTASYCQWPEIIAYPGFNAVQVAELITDLMPLDGFHDYAALRMQIDNAPDEMNGAHKAVFDLLTPRLPEGAKLSSLERQDFYARAKTAFAVVHCVEDHPYGCFILRKGVIF
jgi:L-fucose mutarotase